ncbi:ABC-three component system middle component 1 [Vibrio harveyi]|uniref:ABC-three component system middle component 1 n=1 Tax=Vibrio harveyi TaxID=669 RepID=UPI003CF195C6
MIDNSFYEIEQLPDLLQEEDNLNLYCFDLDEESKIYSFVKTVSNNNELESCWFDLTQVIGTEFICEQSSDFSRWNTYLVFISKEKASQEIRNEIENNKIFVRKIILDNSDLNFDVVEKLNVTLLGFDIDTSIKKEVDDSLKLSNISEKIISNGYSKFNKEDKEKFISLIINENNHEN